MPPFCILPESSPIVKFHFFKEYEIHIRLLSKIKVVKRNIKFLNFKFTSLASIDNME